MDFIYALSDSFSTSDSTFHMHNISEAINLPLSADPCLMDLFPTLEKVHTNIVTSGHEFTPTLSRSSTDTSTTYWNFTDTAENSEFPLPLQSVANSTHGSWCESMAMESIHESDSHYQIASASQTPTSIASFPGSNKTYGHNDSMTNSCPELSERRANASERRREQNRASQRRFRENAKARIQEAEERTLELQRHVEFLEQRNVGLEKKNAQLMLDLVRLRYKQTVGSSRKDA